MTTKVFDACCGIGPWRTRDALLPYEPKDILHLMDHFGVTDALVYGKQAMHGGAASDGNTVADAAAAFSPRFHAAHVLNTGPHGPGPSSIDALIEAGVRAAWHVPPSGVRPSPWLYGEYYAACAERQLPLFIAIGSYTPDDIHQVCAAFPALRLVVTGLDYRVDEWLYPLLRQHSELRACMAPVYNPPLGVERFVARFGPARLLFGSGLPEHSPGGLLGWVHAADVPDEAKERILGGNMTALLQEVHDA